MAGVGETKQEATVRDFLNVLFRRKYMILAVVVVTTCVVVYLTAKQPLSYSSNSRLLIKRGERADVFTGSIRYLPWQEEVSSQVQVILSDAVFKRAGEIFADSLARRNPNSPLRFSGGRVRADVIGESNVFIITYTSFSPIECVIGCNAMTEAFKEYYRTKGGAPPHLDAFFDKEITELGMELERWRTKRNDFLNREDFFGMTEESRFHLNKLSNLELQLASTKSDYSVQAVRVKDLIELVDLSGEELENRLTVSSSQPQTQIQYGVITRIKYQLRNARSRREDLLNKYTEKHPEIIAVDGQIRDLLLELKAEVQNSYSVENSRLAQLLAEQRSIEAEIAKTRAALSTLPDKQLELERMDNAIGSLEGKYDLLLSKRNEAEIAMASAPEWTVTILSPASRPRPRKTKDYVRIALGPFLSLVVGVGLAFFFESMDHSLKNVAEIEEYLGENVLTTISEVRQKG
jgi:uncharacterized protein involved in exopolysaccharide biosynthesis